MDTVGLPGAELIDKGLLDLESGRVTVESLLVSIGATRVSAAGFDVHEPLTDADHRLYALLSEGDSNTAHGRYNALVRRLVSFERAAECVAP